MLSFDFSSPQVQASIITGICSILSATIAAFAVHLISEVIKKRRKLEDDFDLAIEDIAFLLEVERLHCEQNQEKFKESKKNTTRKRVKESGYSFSGKFTPGRIKQRKIWNNRD